MRAVIFDFDGVLADTEQLHYAALRDTLASQGWTLTYDTYLAEYLGYDDRGCVTVFAAAQGVTLDNNRLLQLLHDKERRYAEHLAQGHVLYASAAPCVARLGAEFPLAIASGSLRGEIERILSANDLRHAFRTIVGADDVHEGKPAPESYARAVAALGIAPESAVAIEDSPWGLQSALGAGLRAIGITTSYDAPALVGAHHIVRSLDEVTPELIRQL
jgi:beta-phosphoglucomutase-like phosphatase (HAD superfamily)